MNPLQNSKWIWHNDYKEQNVYLNFFETISAHDGKSYTLYISADSNYTIYINGEFFQSGQFADYPQYKVYDELDLTKALCDGQNNIVIVGYYQGRDFSTYRKEAPGILYEVTCDGQSLLVSDEHTQVCLNSAYKSEGVSAVSGQLGFGFEYDCTREGERVGLKNADVQQKDVQLFPRPIKKLDIQEAKSALITACGEFCDNGGENLAQRMQNAYLASTCIGYNRPIPNVNGVDFCSRYENSDGLYIMVDLGQETVGYTYLDFDVPEECDVLIGYGEHLQDLRVRTSIGYRVFTNSYHAKAGQNKFFMPMRRLGLRYMQLHFYTKQVKIRYAGVKPCVYPLNDEPYFTCSDKLHSKIYDVCIDTLKACMHEHYEDCPWREQALYTMDSRNQMLFGYYAFGEYQFPKASLNLIAQSVREDDFLELCSPARVGVNIPCFSAIFITQVYEYMLYSGDLAFGKELSGVLMRIADGFVNRMGDKGLVKAFLEQQYWNFYEWQDGLSGTCGVALGDEDKLTYDAPLNAFVSMGFGSLSKIFALLGDKEHSQKYLNLHNELNATIHNEFWCDKEQAYYSFINVNSGQKSHFAQLTQSLVVYCGACPDNKLDIVLQAIADGKYLETTLSHRIFVYDALMKKPEKYAKTVLDDIAKRWGNMLYNGATTFWETEKGDQDFSLAGSLCHGWSAVPLYIYYRYAAGLCVSDDGKAEYSVRPVDCGLYEVTAKIATPHKIIEI